MGWLWFALGLAAGLVGASLAARLLARRGLARAAVAERRAASAERLAELGAMTSGLAHEIKNPLSTIGLNAQLLAEGVDDLPDDRAPDPEQRQRLTRRLGALRREVERLRGILADFLAYAGELRLDPSPANLNTLVDELADFFQPQAQQAGVMLRTDLAREALIAPLDASLVKQALLNLMLNAVQALGPVPASPDSSPDPAAHTPINAPTRAAPRELILRTERAREPDGMPAVRVHVIDTGPGMSPEVRARLFTPYFTTKAGGSGLGLATTRRIAEAHQGRVEVHSEPGRGTDFTLVFPAAAPTATPATDRRTVPRADPHRPAGTGQGAEVRASRP